MNTQQPSGKRNQNYRNKTGNATKTFNLQKVCNIFCQKVAKTHICRHMQRCNNNNKQLKNNIEKSIKLATTLQKYSLFFEKVHIFENFYQKQAENHFHHTTLLLETKSSNRHNCPLYSRMYLHVVFVFVMQQVIVIVKCFNAKCKDLRPTSVHVI